MVSMLKQKLRFKYNNSLINLIINLIIELLYLNLNKKFFINESLYYFMNLLRFSLNFV